jgi:hypothetical protein
MHSFGLSQSAVQRRRSPSDSVTSGPDFNAAATDTTTAARSRALAGAVDTGDGVRAGGGKDNEDAAVSVTARLRRPGGGGGGGGGKDGKAVVVLAAGDHVCGAVGGCLIRPSGWRRENVRLAWKGGSQGFRRHRRRRRRRQRQRACGRCAGPGAGCSGPISTS